MWFRVTTVCFKDFGLREARQVFAGQVAVELGNDVHALIIKKTGFKWCGMIRVFRSFSFVDARHVFDKTSKRATVSDSENFLGFCRCGHGPPCPVPKLLLLGMDLWILIILLRKKDSVNVGMDLLTLFQSCFV
eukprot:Gb_35232 [translate_table: standard]